MTSSINTIRPATLEHLDPLGDGISSLSLIRASGSDVDVVNAARVSYGKYVTQLSERDVKLISYLMQHAHTSPFEHNQLSFRVKCPIFVARQWMRHRMNSYNEISYRYAKASEEFYIPSLWRTQDKENKQLSQGAFENQELKDAYQDSLTTAYQTYQKLMEAGVGREIARGVLPLCTYTQFIYTCNLHSLMHFLSLRLGHGTQYEIRVFAQGLFQLAFSYFPISLGAWKELKGSSLDLPTTFIPTLEETLDL
jgi:thymidylate synthase (FAD)